MPIPRVVGRWNKFGLNRITKRIAPQMPGFGVVVHRGRRSGRLYETPVNVFRTQGRTVRLISPRLFRDQSRQDIRPVERQVLRVLGVSEFLALKAAPQAATAPSPP